MKPVVLLVCGSCALAMPVRPALAQSEAAARRECLQAIREQGVRGFALEAPRYVRDGPGATLTGQMVQGPVRLDFTCLIDRQAKVQELSITRPVR
jgi:hypothetical protein